MKTSELIKKLNRILKQEGDLEVVMNIKDTDTSREWDSDDPCIICLFHDLEVDTVFMNDYSDEFETAVKEEKVVQLLPDFVA